MAACIIPFPRPAMPDGHLDQPNLTRYLSERRNRRASGLDELRGILRDALDESSARRALGVLADLKQRVEELERKLSA